MTSNNINIAQVSCVYNEIDILPNQIKYIKSQGLEPYVLDNYSTDGTWEWLQDNNIPSHQFDTKGTFDLEENHKVMLMLSKNLSKNFQWVYFADADLFPVCSDFTIKEMIELADQHNFNSIFTRTFHFENKGEQGNDNVFTKYNEISGGDKWLKIVKISDLKGLAGDGCIVDPMNYVTKIYNNEIILFNYGNVKSLKDRQETFERRKKAWKNGLNKNYGKAYLINSKNNWISQQKTTNVNDLFKYEINKLREIILQK